MEQLHGAFDRLLLVLQTHADSVPPPRLVSSLVLCNSLFIGCQSVAAAVCAVVCCAAVADRLNSLCNQETDSASVTEIMPARSCFGLEALQLSVRACCTPPACGHAWGVAVADTLHRFCKKEHDWGWKKFMELSKVLEGFTVANTLVIKAQVQVIRYAAAQNYSP